MKKSRVAIITARGGSKRIPRKNIKEFLGKPIIEYSIEAALSAGIFDEVMVSTDDEEIAGIAKKAGAKVPFMRSAEAANDFATTTDVIGEVLKQYKETGVEFDFACCIYPTAPFVTKELICKAKQLVEEEGADSCFPMIQFSFPPQRGMIIEDGVAKYKYPEYQFTRSQDLEGMYHDSGQFYYFNVCNFMTTGKMLGEKIKPLVVSEMEAQDIDNEDDWKIAELKYKMLHGKEKNI